MKLVYEEKVCKEVTLGKNGRIDEGVLIGYLPSRKIKDHRTVIGDNPVIRCGSVIYAGVIIGRELETGHNVVIREENVIGDNLRIWTNSVIDFGCVIGNNVRIHCNVYVPQFTTIEDDVFIAPGVAIANDLHPICTKCMKGPAIKKGARIGINATLLPRITIGEFSLIGAGSVVTRDVPPRAVVAGNPAKVICKTDVLKCRLKLVEKPYVDGLDVFLREK